MFKYFPLFSAKPKKLFLSSLITCNKTKLQQIYTHPFNKKLLSGILPQEIFGHYLRDDFLYLRKFSSALINIAKRTGEINSELSNQLNYLANDVINNEQNMQLKYQDHFKNMDEHIIGVAVSEYSNYLIQSSLHEEVSVSLCSILPCFWIYYQIGKMRCSLVVKPNPYQDWLATYSSPQFVKATKQLASAANSIANKSTPRCRLEMRSSFSRAVQYELDFFNEVYNYKLNQEQKVAYPIYK